MRNMDDINFRVGGGLGFLDILQIVFIILKLCHVINWSWLVVFIPFWIQLGLTIIALIVVLIWIFKE